MPETVLDCIGSPAGAGIDRERTIFSILGGRFPRRRGDRPVLEEIVEEEAKVPPQARG